MYSGGVMTVPTAPEKKLKTFESPFSEYFRASARSQPRSAGDRGGFLGTYFWDFMNPDTRIN